MLKSGSSELCWPAALSPQQAALYSTLAQIQASQWLAPAALRALQSRQLAARLQHAATYSAFYQPLLRDRELRAETAFEILASLPPLTRGDFQQHAEAIYCETSPAHGPVGITRTSGSSGEPVAARYTAAAQVLRNAFGLRSLTDWYGLELDQAFAVIRAGIGGNGATEVVRYEHWNPSIGALYGSGPAYELSITQPLEQQLAMLHQNQPRYLMSYPSNLRGLLEQSPANPCGLAFVISMGETLAPDLRDALSQQWQLRVCDEYSAEEVGPIAAQCERGGFHCMAEGVVLEVVDDVGASCAPGEIGRVLVTDLRNFATALIRYELRDYAEVGPPCECGRGLPTLNRIIGRERNLLRLPDGRRFWPMLGLRSDEARRIVRQFQVLQVAPERLHLKIWPQRPLTPSDLRWLLNTLQQATGYPFALDIETLDGPLPRGANGKFQEFQNLLPD